MKSTTRIGFAHLKNAIRDIERSSIAVRDDAKILLRTAGVTGIRPLDEQGGENDTLAYDRFPSDETEDDGMVEV